MENWRSYKFFDNGWIMKKIEHTYNFNFKDKYRHNQAVSECKYTYCCDSIENPMKLSEERTFYSTEAPQPSPRTEASTSSLTFYNKKRKLQRRKRLVKRAKRLEERKRFMSSSSESEAAGPSSRSKRTRCHKVFVHQKEAYKEYLERRDKKFYLGMRLKTLSLDKWNESRDTKRREDKTCSKDVMESQDNKNKSKGEVEVKKELVTAAETTEPLPECPPLPPAPQNLQQMAQSPILQPSLAQLPPLPLSQPPQIQSSLSQNAMGMPPLPPQASAMAAIPPPPPPPPPIPQTIRVVAVNNSGYPPHIPVQQIATIARNDGRQFNEQQIQYGAAAIPGISYEIPVDITYIIGCNPMFRQY